VLDAGDGAHPGGEANPAAIAEQVLAEHQHIAERGRPTEGGRVDQVGFDVDGGQVQDGDTVGVSGGEGGEAEGGGEQGGRHPARLSEQEVMQRLRQRSGGRWGQDEDVVLASCKLGSLLGKPATQPLTVNVADAVVPLWRPLAWKVSFLPG
jgi:hypothetical protein